MKSYLPEPGAAASHRRPDDPLALVKTLTRYIPTLIAGRLAADPAPIRQPTAERFAAALLFVDISGFTRLTERLAQHGPSGVEELSRLLNAYFGQLTDIVFVHGGDVVKFAGDALLAIWPGLPLPEATLRAAQCALAVQAALHDYRVEDHTTLVAALGLPPLAHEDDAVRGVRAARAMQSALAALGVRSAIGVTTGRVFCGTVGSIRRCEYAILGNAVNLAARLMQAALHHPDSTLLCDTATSEAAQGYIAFEALPAITVKGRIEPVPIYRPLEEKRAIVQPKTEMVGRSAEHMQLAERLQALLVGVAAW